MLAKKAIRLTQEMQEHESKNKKARRKVQNHCPHNERRNLEETIKIYQDGGNTYLRCTACGENHISTKPPKSEDLTKAIETVRTAANYTKMRFDAEDEKGGEVVETVGNVLDGLDQLSKIYSNLEKDQDAKRENKKKNASRIAVKI